VFADIADGTTSTDHDIQKGNFLVSISGPICRTKSPIGTSSLLHQIRDAVVQDANDSEGTGSWANVQAVESHVPAPSLTAAHYLRIASSRIEQRAAVSSSIDNCAPTQLHLKEPERAEILRHLGHAIYLSTLMCFVQGLDVMERENEKEKWGINIPRVLEIWKAGCIIKSDAISEILQASYAEGPHVHRLCKPQIAEEVKRHRLSLKKFVLQVIELNAHVPCLSATLEYLKYIGGTDLPTSFTEAQLDSFGAHGYDLKSEPVRHLMKGKC
jgi:6-phosphogluconate dehydrogenase